MTPHESGLVFCQRPPFRTNKSAIINSEPPCPCNCFLCPFGTSPSYVSLRPRLIEADRSTINSALLKTVLPKSLCVSAKAKYLAIPCSRQRKPRESGQRNSAAEFFMIVSGHPAFILPLSGFTGTSSSLRHALSFSVFTLLEERAVDLHFSSLGRKPISS